MGLVQPNSIHFFQLNVRAYEIVKVDLILQFIYEIMSQWHYAWGWKDLEVPDFDQFHFGLLSEGACFGCGFDESLIQDCGRNGHPSTMWYLRASCHRISVDSGIARAFSSSAQVTRAA